MLRHALPVSQGQALPAPGTEAPYAGSRRLAQRYEYKGTSFSGMVELHPQRLLTREEFKTNLLAAPGVLKVVDKSSKTSQGNRGDHVFEQNLEVHLHREPHAQGRGSAWKQAAEQSARLCQRDGPEHSPPSYAGLDQEPARRLTSEMCGRLEEVQWATCVVCWRAWCDLPAGYEFSRTQQGLRSPQAPWFDSSASVITRARKKEAVNQWRLEASGSVEEARNFLAANAEHEAIARRVHEPDGKRVMTICAGCHAHLNEDHVLPAPEEEMRLCDYVVDPVSCSATPDGPAIAHERFEGASPPGLASDGSACSRMLGFSVHEFAHPVAALTDHEEIVLGLVHPLVQVHTIPRTGQLAHVGHICNFRQMTKFLTSLPIMPADMPVVHVRPRKYKGKAGGRALFKVGARKLKAAFLWLKANNPHCANAEWRGDAADAWAGDDAQVGATREADDDSAKVPPVTPTCFERWMGLAVSEAAAGDFGHAIGKRVRELLLEGEPVDAEPDSTDAPGYDARGRARRLVAEVFGQNVYRVATSLSQDIIAVALAARGILDLGLPQGGEPSDALRAIRSLDAHDCPVDLHVFRAELDAAMMEECGEDPEVVRTGATASAEAGDDVGLREDVVHSLAGAAEEIPGRRNEAPGFASARPAADPPAEDASHGHGRKLKYPRVDPPDVEDEPRQAVREDAPGYIAKAFPKLFSHGVGGYHGDRGGLRRALRFEEWGQCAMLWNDGRFMRHTRFRYWLLDTMLRVMVAGAQRVFFCAKKACQDYTLESLMDKGERRELVQQMSTVTNLIPGSIGERRKMRQELEAIVHQIEAETADFGMNGGAGRIPSGFCTLTCSVYKWAQLHATLLKACPSGDADNPAFQTGRPP
ncbi:unnamed protein product [Prorocentrum cordatum]|uniref:DUF6570 domain-containing protein n=1 Tax=Prorocentrum cordatum TaxID=2364126 RepID=A0ABN9WVA0_9DINO|nr:unnamed protein product [Polarella glacialis]